MKRNFNFLYCPLIGKCVFFNTRNYQTSIALCNVDEVTSSYNFRIPYPDVYGDASSEDIKQAKKTLQWLSPVLKETVGNRYLSLAFCTFLKERKNTFDNQKLGVKSIKAIKQLKLSFIQDVSIFLEDWNNLHFYNILLIAEKMLFLEKKRQKEERDKLKKLEGETSPKPVPEKILGLPEVLGKEVLVKDEPKALKTSEVGVPEKGFGAVLYSGAVLYPKLPAGSMGGDSNSLSKPTFSSFNNDEAFKFVNKTITKVAPTLKKFLKVLQPNIIFSKELLESIWERRAEYDELVNRTLMVTVKTSAKTSFCRDVCRLLEKSLKIGVYEALLASEVVLSSTKKKPTKPKEPSKPKKPSKSSKAKKGSDVS